MEVSNKTLAVLLVVSVVVSFAGLVLNLTVGNGITGMTTATNVSELNLTVRDKTSITFTTTKIDFGTGYVDPAYDSCTMDTEGAMQDPNCVDFSTQSAGFLFVNDGNTNLSVQLEFEEQAAAFLGGADPHYEFKIWAAHNRDGSGGDDTVDSCSDNWANTSTFHEVPSGAFYICGSAASYPFSPLNTMDEAMIDINITLPADAPVEVKETTITLTGTSTV